MRATLLALINQQTSKVGQSASENPLIQRLLPGRDIRVGALSEVADKGRHTTTTAELFHLPGGCRLIDSPGVRDFGLSHVSVDAVAWRFREFSPICASVASGTASTALSLTARLRAALEAGIQVRSVLRAISRSSQRSAQISKCFIRIRFP